MTYDNDQDAAVEAAGLAAGMAAKHAAYNTGFSGAKVVCNIPKGTFDNNKEVALNGTADFLNELNGTMYTGCDIGTSDNDMQKMLKDCPYILAAVDHTVNPNSATSYGVFGALEAVMGGSVAGRTVLVHGTGKVGSIVAKLCVAHGATVLCTDANIESSDIEGAENILRTRPDQPWYTIPIDALVPCSISGLINDDIAEQLDVQAICGATNLPFSTLTALHKSVEKGIVFIPEAVASAGAIIVDSIEHWVHADFVAAEPQKLYDFCHEICKLKTEQLLQESETQTQPTIKVLPTVSQRKGPKIGEQFSSWVEGKTLNF